MIPTKQFEYKEFESWPFNRLNELGKEGWEIVSATRSKPYSDSPTYYTGLAKREIGVIKTLRWDEELRKFVDEPSIKQQSDEYNYGQS